MLYYLQIKEREVNNMNPKCKWCLNNYKGTCVSCPSDNSKKGKEKK